MRNNENYAIDRVNLSHCVCLSSFFFFFFFFFFFAVRNDEFRAVTFEIKIIVRPDRCVYFFFPKAGRCTMREHLLYITFYTRAYNIFRCHLFKAYARERSFA